MPSKKKEIEMLDALFKPRSVAIIGASSNPLSIGHIVLKNLLDHDFKGPIYPINPKAISIKSLRSYASIADVPDEVDLVNISIKNALVPAVLEECGKKGVKFAIVHTAGFKETGEEGRRLEERIVAIAHAHGLRIFGPNSQGVQNSDPAVSVYANFTFVPMSPGNISIVSQSGGVGETLKLHLYKIGKGIRMYASFGNEADVSLNEIIDYYGQDEKTRAIMVHVETLRDPAGFLEVASRVTPRKPILAMKTGRTSEGAVAVASHTGSLMEQNTLTDAIFAKSGVLRFHSQEEMVNAAIAFSSQPVPKGDRVVIVTNTGGPAIIAVDECVTAGLKLAKLSDATKDTLKKLVFQEAIVSNPVDVIATAGADQYGGTVAALLEDANIDSLLLVFVTAPFVDCEAIARRLGELGRTATKPIICQVITIEKWAEVIRLIRESGIPVYDYAETAARVLGAMTQYGKLLQRDTSPPVRFKVEKSTAEKLFERNKGKRGFLRQDEAFSLLESYGIRTVETLRVETEEDVEKAAAKIGFPVVLKVDSEEIIHKTEAGGVALNLKNKAELLAAFAGMAKAFAPQKPGYVLQAQAEAGLEMILGLKGNKGLAPTMMFGLGGIFTEVLRDVQFRLTPLSGPTALEMMRSIKSYPLLEGARGESPRDIEALAEMMTRLSQLGTDIPWIDELDLNPVLVYEKGKGAIVVDARIKAAL